MDSYAIKSGGSGRAMYESEHTDKLQSTIGFFLCGVHLIPYERENMGHKVNCCTYSDYHKVNQ